MDNLNNYCRSKFQRRSRAKEGHEPATIQKLTKEWENAGDGDGKDEIEVRKWVKPLPVEQTEKRGELVKVSDYKSVSFAHPPQKNLKRLVSVR